MKALADAGHQRAIEWRAEQLQSRRDWRSRKAEAAGKQYRALGEVLAERELSVHTKALAKIANSKRRAQLQDAHVRSLASLSSADEYRWRYRNDVEFNLKERLRRQVRKKLEAIPGAAELLRAAVKRKGASNKVEAALGYTVAQFKEHMERQFSKGMTWDAWSADGIHIDHILPKKCFDVSTLDGARAYWSLSNLRPLWSKENIKKGERVLFLC